jgi:fatty acid synthase
VTIIAERHVVHMLQQYNGEKRPVWFIFSGMGTQWAGMGKDLMQLEVFEKGIRKCAEALEPEGLNLYDIILSSDESTFDNVMNSFVSIAAVQVNYICNMLAFGISKTSFHSTNIIFSEIYSL